MARTRKEACGPAARENVLDSLIASPAAGLCDANPLDAILNPIDHDDTDDDGRAGNKGGEYNPDGTRARIGLDHDPTLRRRITKRTHRRLLREQAAIEQIGKLPADGEELILILSGKWHGFDLLGAVLELGAPATIRRADISTLAINKTHTRRLEDMLESGQIGRVSLVVGEVFREHTPTEWAELVRVFSADRRRRTLAAARNHSKLMALELTDGRKFTIHGSLNLRRCSCFEQVSIAQDAKTHAFFRRFIADVIREAG